MLIPGSQLSGTRPSIIANYIASPGHWNIPRQVSPSLRVMHEVSERRNEQNTRIQMVNLDNIYVASLVIALNYVTSNRFFLSLSTNVSQRIALKYFY